MPAEATQVKPPRAGLRDCYRELLADARARTLALVEPVAREDMERAHSPLMSPLVWDLAHIAAYEDLWGCVRAGGLEPLRPELAETYDAFETPRSHRGEVELLGLEEALGYMDEVRERALGALEGADLSPAGDGGELTAGGFVWELIVQHEHQHNETMLQTLALAEPGVYAPPRRRELPRAGPGAAGGPETVRVEAGPFAMGAGPADGFAYDNERPAHAVELPAFEIGRLPVTNGQFREFLEEGGYRRREWWSDDGWAWLSAEGAERPLGWAADLSARRSFERLDPLDPADPVMHVSWYEADAYARSRGMRLPSEAEWEKAARLAPAAGGTAHTHPWGALGLAGEVWEWTASELTGYPGFRAFPYREYSEVFFGGGYRVLRGGSWATHPRVARVSFRNWDLPQRRQIFSGFRCARDVEGGAL